MNAIWNVLACSSLLALGSASSQAPDSSSNLVQNGSFENVVWIPFGTPPWVFVDVLAGLTGWSNAPDGRNYIYPVTIYQDIHTTPNQKYLLTFAAAADLFVQPTAAIEVQWHGQTAAIVNTEPHSYDATRNRYEQLAWERFSVRLTASNGISRLLFRTPDDSRFLLDDVKLVPLSNNPPVPSVRVINELNVPPLLYDPNSYSHFVIAPNGVGTSVTLDGSGSTDPDGDALRYVWGYFDEGRLHPLPCSTTNSSATVTCTFYVGDLDREQLGLQVCDGTACSIARFSLHVVAPADVARFLMEDLGELEREQGVRFRSKHALMNALTRARESFEGGDVPRALHFLDQFQQLIGGQQRLIGDPLTQAFVDLSQAVIDAVNER